MASDPKPIAIPEGFQLDHPVPEGFVLDQPGGTVSRKAPPDYWSGKIREAAKPVEEFPERAGIWTAEHLAKAGVPKKAAEAVGGSAMIASELGMGLVGGGPGAAIAKGAAEATLKPLAEKAMQIALKPSSSMKIEKASEAITTLLEKGINVTKGGMDKLERLIAELDTQVRDVIKNSTKSVKLSEPARSLINTLHDFRSRTTFATDEKEIKKAWQEFLQHPWVKGKTEIPIQKAQELKQGTSQMVKDVYTKEKTLSPRMEGHAGIAEGLRTGIAKEEPRVQPLNEEMSKLLNVKRPLEKRVIEAGGQGPSGVVGAMHNPLTWGTYLAERNPMIASLIARGLYNSPTVAGAAGGIGGAAATMPFASTDEVKLEEKDGQLGAVIRGR